MVNITKILKLLSARGNWNMSKKRFKISLLLVPTAVVQLVARG